MAFKPNAKEEVTITVKNKELELLTSIKMTTADPTDVAECLMALTRKYNYGFEKQTYTFNVYSECKVFDRLVHEEACKISAMRKV